MFTVEKKVVMPLNKKKEFCWVHALWNLRLRIPLEGYLCEIEIISVHLLNLGEECLRLVKKKYLSFCMLWTVCDFLDNSERMECLFLLEHNFLVY